METFKINEVAFDMAGKEYVKITNLRCPICAQGGPICAQGIAGVECATEPFEGLALRVLPPISWPNGINKNSQNSVPRIGFTYRQIKASNLRKVKDQSVLDCYLKPENMSPVQEHFLLIGRI